MCWVLLSGAWEPIACTTPGCLIFTPFFTLGPYWVRLYSSFYLQHSLQEKGCCRGLYSTHALSHGPISIQQLYSAVERCRALQLYSGSTVYRLYTLPLAVLLRQQSTAVACSFLKKMVGTSSSLKAERLVVGKGRLRRRNSRLRRPCVRRLARGGSAPGPLRTASSTLVEERSVHAKATDFQMT